MRETSTQFEKDYQPPTPQKPLESEAGRGISTGSEAASSQAFQGHAGKTQGAQRRQQTQEDPRKGCSALVWGRQEREMGTGALVPAGTELAALASFYQAGMQPQALPVF